MCHSRYSWHAGNITALIHVTAALHTSGFQALADVLHQPAQLRPCPAAMATTMAIIGQCHELASDLSQSHSPWTCGAEAGGSWALCTLDGQTQSRSAYAPLPVMLAEIFDPTSELPGTASLHASQQLLGAGEVSATFLLELQRTQGHTSSDSSDGSTGEPRPRLIVCSRTTMPWFLRPWIHTLAAAIDGTPIALDKVLYSLFLASPAPLMMRPLAFRVWVLPGATRSCPYSSAACHHAACTPAVYLHVMRAWMALAAEN